MTPPVDVHKQQTGTELQHSRQQKHFVIVMSLLREEVDHIRGLLQNLVSNHCIWRIILQNVITSGHDEDPDGTFGLEQVLVVFEVLDLPGDVRTDFGPEHVGGPHEHHVLDARAESVLVVVGLVEGAAARGLVLEFVVQLVLTQGFRPVQAVVEAALAEAWTLGRDLRLHLALEVQKGVCEAECACSLVWNWVT